MIIKWPSGSAGTLSTTLFYPNKKFGVRNSQAKEDGMGKKQKRRGRRPKRLTAEQKEAQQLARVGLHFNTVTKQFETLPIHVTTNVPRDEPDRQVADESDQ